MPTITESVLETWANRADRAYQTALDAAVLALDCGADTAHGVQAVMYSTFSELRAIFNGSLIQHDPLAYVAEAITRVCNALIDDSVSAGLSAQYGDSAAAVRSETYAAMAETCRKWQAAMLADIREQTAKQA